MVEPNLAALADAALSLVRAGMVVGLGSGRASTMFIEALGARRAEGLNIRGVPTSESSAALADRLGIPLVTLDDVDTIDVAVDGADEVDPHGNCIKGYGGALVREKIVAAAARQFVILVGSEKVVSQLGERGKLPVEVTPFAAGFCRRRLLALGLNPQTRHAGAVNYITDNGNLILDCGVPILTDPAQLERDLLDIPGVLGTGLFLQMATTVLIERNGAVERMKL